MKIEGFTGANKDHILFFNNVDHFEDCIDEDQKFNSLKTKENLNLIKAGLNIPPKILLQQINANINDISEKFTENNKNLQKLSQIKYNIKQKIFLNIENDYELQAEIEKYYKSIEEIIKLNDCNEPFVYSYRKFPEKLSICMTTKNLLKLCLQQAEKDFLYLAVDGIYKMLKLGYPLLVILTSDKKARGYPLSYCISENEDEDCYFYFIDNFKKLIDKVFSINYNASFLMADGSHSIRNAAKKVFPSIVLLMCRFHFHSNLNKKFYSKDFFDLKNKIPEEESGIYSDLFNDDTDYRQIIKNDVYILQNLPKSNVF